MSECVNLIAEQKCSRFGVVRVCPRGCPYRIGSQMSFFDDGNMTSELDEWILSHNDEYTMICDEFCRLGEEENYISVRDIFSGLRKQFRGKRKTNNERYAFNNNYTSALSAHLCAKFPQYAHKVSHKGEWRKVVGVE